MFQIDLVFLLLSWAFFKIMWYFKIMRSFSELEKLVFKSKKIIVLFKLNMIINYSKNKIEGNIKNENYVEIENIDASVVMKERIIKMIGYVQRIKKLWGEKRLNKYTWRGRYGNRQQREWYSTKFEATDDFKDLLLNDVDKFTLEGIDEKWLISLYRELLGKSIKKAFKHPLVFDVKRVDEDVVEVIVGQITSKPGGIKILDKKIGTIFLGENEGKEQYLLKNVFRKRMSKEEWKEKKYFMEQLGYKNVDDTIVERIGEVTKSEEVWITDFTEHTQTLGKVSFSEVITFKEKMDNLTRD
jgi:hypothetical protein